VGWLAGIGARSAIGTGRRHQAARVSAPLGSAAAGLGLKDDRYGEDLTITAPLFIQEGTDIVKHRLGKILRGARLSNGSWRHQLRRILQVQSVFDIFSARETGVSPFRAPIRASAPALRRAVTMSSRPLITA
jgi:hypothetical protein